MANMAVIDEQTLIIAYGTAYDNAGVSHGIIRRTTDGGQTWSTVMDYNYAPGKGMYFSQYISRMVRIGNALYTIGFGADEADRYHALVFRSLDQGQSWSLVLDISDDDTLGSNWISNIATDGRSLYLSVSAWDNTINKLMRLSCN